MNIAILGNSKFTYLLFKEFKKNLLHNITVVFQKKKIQPKNSFDFKSHLKNKNGLYYETSDINSHKTKEFLKSKKLDIILSTWPKILDEEVINLPKICTIGSHPTNLPINRGRHPLHWLIVMRCKHSYLSFFIMDKKIDNGDLIYKKKYYISENDTIQKVEEKLNKLVPTICKKLLNILKKKKIKKLKQQKRNANYLRKRNILDLVINLKMDFKSIKKLVASYSFPYEGSILIFNDQLIRIFNVKKIKGNIYNKEIGKIIKTTQSYIISRCSDSLIKLEFKKIHDKKIFYGKKYIHDPIYYLLMSKKIYKRLNKLFLEN